MKEVWDVKRYINHNKNSKRKGKVFFRLWEVFDTFAEAREYCFSHKGDYQISSRIIKDESQRWPVATTYNGLPIYNEKEVVFKDTLLSY